MAEQKKTKRGDRENYQLKFVGLKTGDERPDVLLQAVDQKNRVLHSAQVDAEGNFALPAEVLKKSYQVIIGPPAENGDVASQGALQYRSSEFAASIHDGVFAVAEGAWAKLYFDWVCVSGRVEVCRRKPWWFDSIMVAAASPVTELALSRKVSQFSRTAVTVGELLRLPLRCYPVCLGTVEVYRRTCCCYPLVIEGWQTEVVIKALQGIVARLPKTKPPRFGPPPPPPPVDPLNTPIFEGGALNEMALNAVYDLDSLRSLPREQAAAYISQRPYLMRSLCHCGQSALVHTGNINPDGTFNICWREFRRLYRIDCYDQYAYVVKQTIGDVTTTIYDGRAAGIWFAGGDDAVLSSYNSNAFSCGETGTAPGDAVVFLDLIGDTESHELITPDATAWDRVNTPNADSGLLYPAEGPFSSYKRNMGGSLELTFQFSLSMRDPNVGAMYYRVSVCRADSTGKPIDTPSPPAPSGPQTRFYYGDGLAWNKVVGLNVVPESLGPNTVGGEANLYKIPWSDEPWTGNVRYHAVISTLRPEFNLPYSADPLTDLNYQNSPSELHLITLEIFNSAGERLRPLGTSATGQPGTEVAKPFKFLRWFQASGSPGDDLKPVNYGALTHMFLWDNRPPIADITRLVENGVASSEECQFLVGNNSSTFGIEYRSYLPDQRCLYDQEIGWLRGLNATAANGGIGTLGTPNPPVNVGQPSAGPDDSGTETFQTMLTRLDDVNHPPNPPTVLPKCSFAVTLTTWAKTTDGGYLPWYPYAQETAAFALEISPAPMA